MVLTLINTSKNEIFYFPKHSYLSTTVYIDTKKCHLTLIKHRQIKDYASVTY